MIFSGVESSTKILILHSIAYRSTSPFYAFLEIILCPWQHLVSLLIWVFFWLVLWSRVTSSEYSLSSSTRCTKWTLCHKLRLMQPFQQWHKLTWPMRHKTCRSTMWRQSQSNDTYRNSWPTFIPNAVRISWTRSISVYFRTSKIQPELHSRASSMSTVHQYSSLKVW